MINLPHAKMVRFAAMCFFLAPRGSGGWGWRVTLMVWQEGKGGVGILGIGFYGEGRTLLCRVLRKMVRMTVFIYPMTIE